MAIQLGKVNDMCDMGIQLGGDHPLDFPESSLVEGSMIDQWIKIPQKQLEHLSSR